jgi:Flp pilus assembly CpaE family ATPase
MLAIKDLSTGDLEVILRHMTRRDVERGGVLFEAGDKALAMFFVESGSLKLVSRKAKDGHDDVLLAVIKPGAFCGETALLGEESFYEDTAVAMEHSVVLELTKESMQKVMLASMTAGTKLLLGISRNIREAISMPMAQETGKIIAFISPKDGMGRTSIATHLAWFLAKAGKRVIVIDGDLQLGDACVHLGLKSQPHMARLIQNEERLVFDSIKKYFQNLRNVSLLAGPSQPQEAEFVSRSNLNQVIQECSRNCDFLILDVPSHIDDISILMWDVADLMVFVTEGNISAMSRLKRLLATLQRLNYPQEKFFCLLNKYRQDQGEYLDNYRKLMPFKWQTVASAEKQFGDSTLRGIPIWEIDAACEATKNLQSFCEQVLGRPQNNEKGGIFSRIKSMFAG